MKKFVFGIIFLLVLTGISWGEGKDVTWMDYDGTIYTSATPSSARIHLLGALSLDSADYFRGAFNGVEEDLDDWAFKPSLAMVVQLWGGRDEIRNLNLTVGSANGISDVEDEFGGAGEPDLWYKANPYAALSLEITQKWKLGMGYTAYSSPDQVLGSWQELAFTAAYIASGRVGEVSPQVKLAIPVNDGDGFYTEASIDPAFKIGNSQLTLDIPAVVGIGWADYYDDKDTALWAGLGVKGTYPVNTPTDYGNWSLFAGLYLNWRENAIVDLGKPIDDDAGNLIAFVNVGVSFIY